jgi:hypothetical protein
MFNRRDRQDFGVLALALVLFGLVFAPVLHAFGHAHGHRHSHGGAPASHPSPSLEHFTLATHGPPAAQTGLAVRGERRPERPITVVLPNLESLRLSEQSQAPPAIG